MTPALASAGFSAIGSEARLAVLKSLVRAGEDGLNISDIRDKTGIAPTTLAHHIRSLVGGGLVTQEKRGRETINRADFDQLRALADYILEECCADVCSDDCGESCASDGCDDTCACAEEDAVA
ncbi:ArsR/SmtB family transcription factor [Maritimibacter dapengensis]|uniref:ArsR family transcriptional regulator n=1 Tax=Maritimibacter dapengensis TaxID=2836868 RepID=A0ABS6T5A2_9RHOB|nr:helix-turn-helix transcriptional regulator [Maritimibacter dapengensis]MBV7380412.1 ArsR family transcriptional regulator [Maritimibacter dapengensis]